jgi:hypothetical protein
MLNFAARTGYLEGLREWGREGVRVMTAQPLITATMYGFPEVMRCLVQELGADVNHIHDGNTALLIAAEVGFSNLVQLLVTELGADINQGIQDVGTPLTLAAYKGQLAVVRCLIELGAEVEAANSDSDTALLESAVGGRFTTMQYLLEEAGANIEDVDNGGGTVWDMLTLHLEDVPEDRDVETDLAALASLLQVMLLRGDPPLAVVALLSPEDTDIVQEGARLRAQLPAYLAHRRAYLDLRCPRVSLLPGVLRALIYTCEELATTEELWATGLGEAPGAARFLHLHIGFVLAVVS